MRTFAFVALVFCGLMTREAAAQGFAFVPPGYGYGAAYSGIDLGNGIHFGCGIGGFPVSPAQLNSSVTDTYVPPFQELCDSHPSYISRGTVAPVAGYPTPGFSSTPKKPGFSNVSKKQTKVTTAKKSGSKKSGSTKSVKKATPVKAKSAKQSQSKQADQKLI